MLQRLRSSWLAFVGVPVVLSALAVGCDPLPMGLGCALQSSSTTVSDSFNRADSGMFDTSPGCSDSGHQWADESSNGGHLLVRSNRVKGVATDESGQGDYVNNGAIVNDALSRYSVEADFYPSPTPNRCALQMLVTEPAPQDRIFVNGSSQPVPYGFIHLEMSKYFWKDTGGTYHFDGTDQIILIVKSPQTTGFYYASPNPVIHFTPGGGPYHIRVELDGNFARVYVGAQLAFTMDLTNPGSSGPVTPWDPGFFAAMSNHGLHISAGVGGGGASTTINWADDLGSSFDNFAVKPLP